MQRPLDLTGMPLHNGAVAHDVDCLRVFKWCLGILDIFGKIDENGARSTAASDVKRLFQDARQIFDLFDEVVVLHAGAGDADGIAFLESI